ncbi:MAG: hypothetical protein US51_C0032G0005 [Microgenomates group bacterium GW2011_GWA2_37_6]|nr:MAG: hypothetical protein US51_C0032G0005 [Microgenomates group bacterium GW2011_GWA2_37_6]
MFDKSQLLSWVKFLIGWPLSFISLAFIAKMQLEEKGYKVDFRENTYRFAFSEIKRYTPGNIWSFLSRVSQFRELGVDKKTVGVSILADIQLVIIGCSVASLFSIPWLLDSPIEIRTKLASLLPISVLAVVIFFIVTGLIYAKSLVLHSTRPISNFLLPGLGLNSKIKLSALATITYATFGVGNYFVFLSIFNNNFQDFLILSSFFVFSLLIGYLSFITPMGLGIREGVVTLGLSKITSLTNAGAIAIFTRIVLIVSELLFLLFVFLWKRFSKN